MSIPKSDLFERLSIRYDANEPDLVFIRIIDDQDFETWLDTKDIEALIEELQFSYQHILESDLVF